VKTQQLREFRSALLAWFAQFQRDLPWRRTQDAYRVWVSEIMLQQTRVAAVIPYYERFLNQFPNIQALAEAPQDEVLRLWSGLGYYSRARNLQQAAKQIIAQHGGEFPHNKGAALGLAGVGEYTAAAILSIAFGEKLAVLDGNVARVLARLDVVRGDLRGQGRWAKLQTRAGELLAPDAPGDWNQAMMELGATVCTPRAPQCLLCPVQKYCEARKLGIAEQLPEKRKKRATISVQLAAVVFLDASDNSLVLPPPADVFRSEADDHVPSLVAKLWHFPTVAVVGNADQALKKFLSKELKLKGISGWRLEELEKVSHTVTYRKITVLPFAVRVKALPQIEYAKQIELRKILEMPISNLTRKVARVALARLPVQHK